MIAATCRIFFKRPASRNVDVRAIIVYYKCHNKFENFHIFIIAVLSAGLIVLASAAYGLFLISWRCVKGVGEVSFRAESSY